MTLVLVLLAGSAALFLGALTTFGDFKTWTVRRAKYVTVEGAAPKDVTKNAIVRGHDD